MAAPRDHVANVGTVSDGAASRRKLGHESNGQRASGCRVYLTECGDNSAWLCARGTFRDNYKW